MSYPYTIQDLLCGIGATPAAPTGGVWEKLSQRADVFTLGPQWIADSILEFSRDYPFQDLEDTSGLISLVPGVCKYPVNLWLSAPDRVANLIPSFFMYYNYPTNAYSGIGLTYKSIDSLELMLGIPGTPAYWSRFAGQIYIAPIPNLPFVTYMRFQKQHPFSNPAALTDIIKLPDEWREIAEYSAALRGANNLRMLDYAASYKNTLFGDPKKPGDLGLLTARVMQLESDIVSNQGIRQIRPLIRR